MEQWHTFEYEGTSGERCDVAITLELSRMPEFAELSRAKVQALIEREGVAYDGKIIPRSQKNLRPGMVIEVNLKLLRELLRPPAPEHIEPVDLPLTFHHVDEHLAVVEKPAGISVHPSVTEDGLTLTAALLHHFGQLSDAGGADRPGIVHRLDKETSGLLVVARDNQTHAALSRQFAGRLVEKEYAALCLDRPEHDSGRIESPIERHPRHRQKMWSGGGGRSAQSEYRLREMWGPLALLDVAIFTGRTHQIRVHLLEVGCAILGDDKYGGGRNGALRKFLRDGRDSGASRQWRTAWPEADTRRRLLELLESYTGIFLHARRLAFQHPVTKQGLSFESELPAIWRKIQATTVAAQPPGQAQRPE